MGAVQTPSVRRMNDKKAKNARVHVAGDQLFVERRVLPNGRLMMMMFIAGQMAVRRSTTYQPGRAVKMRYRKTQCKLSFGIVFFVVFRMVILATIFLGTILLDAIEDDAGNAFMNRHSLYGGLDHLAGR
jgi:hypothetical protein